MVTSPPAVRAGIVKTGHRYGRVPVAATRSRPQEGRGSRFSTRDGGLARSCILSQSRSELLSKITFPSARRLYQEPRRASPWSCSGTHCARPKNRRRSPVCLGFCKTLEIDSGSRLRYTSRRHRLVMPLSQCVRLPRRQPKRLLPTRTGSAKRTTPRTAV